MPFNFGYTEIKLPADVAAVRVGATDGGVEADLELPLSNDAVMPPPADATALAAARARRSRADISLVLCDGL